MKLPDANETLRTIEKFKTNLQWVNLAYRMLEKHNGFFKFHKDSKCRLQSLAWRCLGNHLFKSGNYLEAIKNYTLSLAHAESKEMAAVSYGNRAAALQKLNLHRECLVDIERALICGCPEALKRDLLRIRQFSEANLAPVDPYFEKMPDIVDRNPLLDCARAVIEIQLDSEFKTHVVATEDIEIGEVISIEPPFAATLTNERLVHCNACLVLCYNLIPCDNCTGMFFCGNECKENALQSYHKYECPILLTLSKQNPRFGFFMPVPIRMILKIQRSDLERDYNNYNKDNQRFLNGTKFYSDKLEDVLCLKTNAKGRPLDKTFEMSIFAAQIFNVLKYRTDFFKQFEGIPNFESKLKHLILLIEQVCDTACNYVNEFSKTAQDDYLPESFGRALYPLHSIINNSCIPNVFFVLNGAKMAIMAIRSIKKGEECCYSYGPHYYYRMSKPERSYMFSHDYYFECACRACVEDWPLFDSSVRVIMPREFYTISRKLYVDADVQYALQVLPRIYEAMREAERDEPSAKAKFIFDMIISAFFVLGNKRRI